MNCKKCNKELKRKTREFKEDGLCGVCRWIEKSKTSRKTKQCSGCGKPILPTSKYCYSCVQKGNRNRKYTTGIHSKENKKYCPNCGIEISRKAKTCIKCRNFFGSNNPNYVDGKSKEKYLLDKQEYKDWRLAVFLRDKKICALCNKKQRSPQAHHILPKRDFPLLTFNIDNGITLCKTCHKLTYGKEYDYSEFFLTLNQAELKFRESVDGENPNAESIRKEDVETRAEISCPTSTGERSNLLGTKT